MLHRLARCPRAVHTARRVRAGPRRGFVHNSTGHRAQISTNAYNRNKNPLISTHKFSGRAKFDPEVPSGEQIAGWHREIWNQGFAPLLWVVSPEKIELYNGFGRPRQIGNAAEHRLRTFERIESKLEELDAFAGRLAMETGRFWQEPRASEVDRKTSVDRQLLSDLAALERDLVAADMSRPDAQGLIGRSIFTQYLIDRRIVTTRHLAGVYGHGTLAAILRDRRATKRLFGWLREVFNGDMFPSEGASVPRAGHLRRVADFLEAVDPDTGQMTSFRTSST